jgi:predicted  nucleic acid-binding Zn-ribbon protein
MGVVFDKLNFMKRLEDAGTFTRPQAEALSEAFHQAVSESVATKQDVAEARHETAELRTELKAEISKVRTELKAEISQVRTELTADISELRTEVRAGFGEIRSEMKAGLAETKVWSVSIAASIVAVLAAMKYFG